MRVLILGGTGMLGHKLVQVLSADPRLDVHCSVRAKPLVTFETRSATYHERIDVSRESDLRTLITRCQPDCIINAIGAVKQKDLSNAMTETFFINGTLPHLIPLLAHQKARVIHFSTDCVFAGDRGGYVETDLVDAEDLYGRSKACGEIGYGRHLTIRTSIIGFELSQRLGLLSWLFTQRRGLTINGYSEAIFSGLPTYTLAQTVRALLSADNALTGLFHVASKPIDKFNLLSRLNVRFDLGLYIQPSRAVKIDRSLNDDLFRTVTRTTTPDWEVLVEELASDFASLPYSTVYPVKNAK